jgi:primosomal protein N' (replication factor Y)
MLNAIDSTLSEKKQVLIFHNRRGTANVTLCENCGWQAGCPRCFIPLTLHADKGKLICHICSFSTSIPTSCPECGSTDILHKGIGTKLIESELKRLYPDKSIMRFDGDSAPDARVDSSYTKLYQGDIDIIIGTQVIAKGLDLPHLRTVCVVQADAGLSLPDYTAAERTFQLLYQVIGRVGRSKADTNVIIQSYQPDHPAVIDGINRDYQDFYTRTIKLRQKAGFPPFSFLLKLTCTYKTEATAIRNAKQLSARISELDPTLEILGPTPAFYERVRDTYRWQIVVKSNRRAKLIAILSELPKKGWQFELDPISLL